jgi:hypothetical protein
MRPLAFVCGTVAAVLVGSWAVPTGAQECQPTATALCLQEGRFRVEAEWRGADQDPFSLSGTPDQGTGTAIPLGFDDTGCFGLSDPDTPELLIRVLDGRAVNDHFWVFVAGATSLGVTVTVTDTVTEQQRSYVNQPAEPFESRTDTSAFEDSDRRAASTGSPAVRTEPPAWITAGCAPPALCLVGDRFEVRASWRDFQGSTGGATGVGFNDESGFVWFFHDENLELLVRMVDGRSVNGSYWFAAAGFTNVAVTVRLTDTMDGRSVVYRNPLGTTFETVLDRAPFISLSAQVASLGAARVAGASGSDWHDRQLFKAGPDGAAGTLYLTPRGQQFDPEGDPSLRLMLGPRETMILEEVHEQLLPGEYGAGTLRLVPDPESAVPLWRSAVYNLDGDAEYGMVTRPFDAAADGFFGPGTTIGTVLSPAGFRDNVDATTGPEGLRGAWIYRTADGGTQVEVAASYPGNTTVQFRVRNVIGLEPEPGASLDFRIDGGSGRVFLSRNHDVSNDPARDELEPVAGE